MQITQQQLTGQGRPITGPIQLALRGLQPDCKLVISGHNHKQTGYVCHDVSVSHMNARRWGMAITTRHKGKLLEITRVAPAGSGEGAGADYDV